MINIKALRVTRTLFYAAEKEGRFEGKNPFRHITLKGRTGNKQKLSIQDIEKIEALDLPSDQLIWQVRNYFMFAFYAGGFRASDLCLLEWKHVKDQGEEWRLAYRMKKTDEARSINLLPQARAILEHYKDRKGKKRHVFPLLDCESLKTAKEVHNAIGGKTALMNKYLEKIRERAEITTPITTHIARHSIADFMRAKGVSIYAISKALGHANIRVTEKYLKGFDSKEVDDALKGLFS